MTIYVITNNVNNKQYVGMTIRPVEYRIEQHFKITHSGTCFLSKAIAKYGKENFSYRVLEVVTNKDELKQQEKYWIARLETQSPKGYNYQEGGIGGMNDALIKRMRPVICLNTATTYSSITEAADMLGLSRSNISSVCRGKVDTIKGMRFEYLDIDLNDNSNDVRNKRRNHADISLKNAMTRFNKTKRIEIVCVTTGDTYCSMTVASQKTGISIQSIFANCQGNTDRAKHLRFEYVDIERKLRAENNITTRKLNFKKLKETRITNMSLKNKKPIKCLTTGEIFSSISEAARHLKVHPSSISLVVRGVNKTAKGLTFEYCRRK